MAAVLITDTISPFNPAGMSRYFQKILIALVTEFGSDVALCSARGPCVGSARFIAMPWFRGSERLHIHDTIASVCSLLFRPSVYYSPSYARAVTSAPQTYTVYDMTHEMFPQQVLQRPSSLAWFINRKRRCLEQASILFAISRYTAQTVIELYPHIDPSKILVTPLGVEALFFEPNVKCALRPPKPYFLYVGQRTPYKNFGRLLTAFAQSGLSEDFDLRVISPVGGGFNETESRRIQELNLQRNIQLSTGVSESELARSYGLSAALVYPSLHEGFGLPILEALASGTIVATSNISSMPEVGGEAALYFDPHSTEDMAGCLQRIAELSAEERKALVDRSVARARAFPWSRCQRQTIDAIKTLM